MTNKVHTTTQLIQKLPNEIKQEIYLFYHPKLPNDLANEIKIYNKNKSFLTTFDCFPLSSPSGTCNLTRLYKPYDVTLHEMSTYIITP
jgi:hypothetical protein